MFVFVPTEVLGVMKASGVISLGIGPVAELDRKSAGAGRGGIFLRSVWEPLPESLSELWSVRLSEKPPVKTKKKGSSYFCRKKNIIYYIIFNHFAY